MRKVRVTFPDGRIVEGEITGRHKASYGRPVLIAEGIPCSGLDAVIQGLSIYPVNDPAVDVWLNTVRIEGR